MTVTTNAQSLAEFHDHADETLARLRETGEAEFLTVDGEARAVLLSPELYEAMAHEYQLSRDVEVMKRSMEQHRRGETFSVAECFDHIHAMLLAKKAGASGTSATDRAINGR